MDLAPTQKYEVPQTSSQEYGWCSRPLVCVPFYDLFCFVLHTYLVEYKYREYCTLLEFYIFLATLVTHQSLVCMLDCLDHKI